ncbi:MAG: prepilin-type N-terminal cleavage/methylation domain-containing protein [Verrucomicrobiae bacterium]|nr:prepilin-type N-terminal cleavage/methylation domain-containing protein [Verrucomicrobiae bacterium]
MNVHLQPRSKPGFTLVELLLVVAILALLAALLLPVMSRAKPRAQRAACMNNQRQLYLLLQAHALDHDGAVPLGYRLGRKQFNTTIYVVPPGHGVLLGRLHSEGLLAEPGILYCPAERDPLRAFNTPENPWPPRTNGVSLQGGYGSNPVVDWAEADTPPHWPKLEALRPTAVLADIVGLPARVDSRHRDGVNATGNDGSVGWVKRARFNAALSQCTTLDAAWNPAQDEIWRALSAR